jgi:lysozyme
VKRALVRATMGGTGVDAKLASYAREAAAAGLELGFYHLMRPEFSGETQARHFLATVAPYAHPLGLAVDVERVVNPLKQLTPAQYADELAAFVRRVEASTGELPTIYTSQGEWAALVARQHDRLFGECKLWVANYEVTQPNLPRCWTDWWLWQFTSSGRVDGIAGRTDLNRLKKKDSR